MPQILIGHFSDLFIVKNCNVGLKRLKINEKRPTFRTNAISKQKYILDKYTSNGLRPGAKSLVTSK